MQAAGDLVGAFLELSAGMQNRHHHVDGRNTGLVHRHRDTAAVIGDFHATVVEEPDVDLIGKASHRLVDGIVDDLPDQVM